METVVPKAQGKAAALSAYLAQGGGVSRNTGRYRSGKHAGKDVDQVTAEFEAMWANAPDSIKQKYADRTSGAMSDLAPSERVAAANAETERKATQTAANPARKMGSSVVAPAGSVDTQTASAVQTPAPSQKQTTQAPAKAAPPAPVNPPVSPKVATPPAPAAAAPATPPVSAPVQAKTAAPPTPANPVASTPAVIPPATATAANRASSPTAITRPPDREVNGVKVWEEPIDPSKPMQSGQSRKLTGAEIRANTLRDIPGNSLKDKGARALRNATIGIVGGVSDASEAVSNFVTGKGSSSSPEVQAQIDRDAAEKSKNDALAAAQNLERIKSENAASEAKRAGVTLSPNQSESPMRTSPTSISPQTSDTSMLQPQEIQKNPITPTKPVRINKETGLPFGYRPGDTVAPEQAGAAAASVQAQKTAATPVMTPAQKTVDNVTRTGRSDGYMPTSPLADVRRDMTNEKNKADFDAQVAAQGVEDEKMGLTGAAGRGLQTGMGASTGAAGRGLITPTNPMRRPTFAK